MSMAMYMHIALTTGLIAPTTYFASCVKGMEPILAAELSAAPISALNVEEGHLGVHFDGPPAIGARAALWSRSTPKSASRWNRALRCLP